jgi:serine-type D-Ala-D-Ala endopeptidase (penicillin-binding protein 7)
MRTFSWQKRLLIPALLSITFTYAAHCEPSQQANEKLARGPASAISTSTSTVARTKTASAKTARPHSARAAINKLDLRSSSVLIMDEADESILYSKQPKKVMPVASITKLMTALVVLEGQQPLDEMLEVSALDRDTEHGSASRLLVGTHLSREDLLHLALMSSENRAAHAVARHYPGGIAPFIRAMNAKARQLDMMSTHFVDPTGLSSDNVSSAADLIKLVLAASADPVIQKFSTHQSYSVPVGRQVLEFRNTNTLVSKADWDISVQKTGYTQAAGRCLVMKTLIQDRSVVIVLLNSFGKYTRVADVRRIRKWIEAAAPPARLAHQ